jgi:cell division protein FtsX
VDISVYFKYEVPEEEILEAKVEIAEIPEVKEVKYVPKKKLSRSLLKDTKITQF